MCFLRGVSECWVKKIKLLIQGDWNKGWKDITVQMPSYEQAEPFVTIDKNRQLQIHQSQIIIPDYRLHNTIEWLRILITN